MEITTLFALFIGTIIVVHFLDLIVEPLRARKQQSVRAGRKSWYCFFSPKILTGEESYKETVGEDLQQENIVDRDRKRRQQEQRRPVLRA